MTTLNKTFQQNQILTAAELNAIVDKVDEIVTLLSSLPEGLSGITDAQVKAKIDAAIEEANRLIDEAIAHLQEQITDLKNVQEGATQVVTEEEWAQYRKKTDDLETDVAAIKLTYDGIDLTALKQKVDDINELAGSIHVAAGKIEILAALLDENNQLIINPASIIAAIVDKDGKLTSEIVVSADQVILQGDVTLTDGLNVMNGEITNLTSSTADIRTRLTAAEAAIGEGEGNEEFEKMKQDLEDLSLVVNGKAAIEDLNALSATVGNKTDKSDFQGLVDDLDSLALTVNGKAAIADLNALLATVGNKTDNTDFQGLVKDLDDLTLVVNGKAAIEDLTALNATIAGKASIEDLEAVKTVTDRLKVNKEGEIGITDMFAWSTENGSKGGLTVPSTGSTYPNDVEITNEIGVHVTNDNGSDVLIGNGNDGFGVYANGQKGFTGTINFAGTANGIRFVNGICVGTTDN